MLQLVPQLLLAGRAYDLSAGSPTSSTITLSFLSVPGARSYEYAVSSTSAVAGFGAWTALAADKIITGLSVSTQYWAKVRIVNGVARGPASPVVTGTTSGAAGIALSFAAQTANPGAGATFSFSAGGNTINSSDVIVIWAMAQAGGSDPGSMLPTGFTAFTGGDFFDGASTAERVLFAFKVAGGAESGSYSTPTMSPSLTFSTWGLAVYSGAASGVDVSSASIKASSTNCVSPSLTAAATNEMLLCLSCDEGNAGPYTNFGSMTGRLNTNGSGKSPMELRLAELQLSSSGATGTFTATSTSGTVHASAAILLKP